MKFLLLNEENSLKKYLNIECEFLINNNIINIKDNIPNSNFSNSYEVDEIIPSFSNIFKHFQTKKSNRIISVCSSQTIPLPSQVKNFCLNLSKYYFDNITNNSEISFGFINNNFITDLLSTNETKCNFFDSIPINSFNECYDLIEIGFSNINFNLDDIFIFKIGKSPSFEYVILPSVEQSINFSTNVSFSASKNILYFIKHLINYPKKINEFINQNLSFSFLSNSFKDLSTIFLGHISQEVKLLSNVSILNFYKNIKKLNLNEINQRPNFYQIINNQFDNNFIEKKEENINNLEINNDSNVEINDIEIKNSPISFSNNYISQSNKLNRSSTLSSILIKENK